MTAVSDAIPLDLLVVGGGIAGLWTLNRACKAGYNAILFEKGALGGGQSVHSQGIIHGGTKYALKGALTRAANAIAEMPARWKACLAAKGELDLSTAGILSDATYFWAQGSLRAKMTSFLASKALRGRVKALAAAERPVALAEAAGALYRVDEPVLDVASVIGALASPFADRIRQIDGAALNYETDSDGKLRVALPGGIVVQPACVLLTAGEGFPELAARLRIERPRMQSRPLHMVAVRHRAGLKVFGHCIGTATTPVVTVTSHAAGNDIVWYLGGGIAESGVTRTEGEQIAAAKAALALAMPWVNLDGARWATLRIDRAEPASPKGARPDNAFAEAVGRIIVGWPTKLALAPDLADRVLALLPPPREERGALGALGAFPAPSIARPFWEEL